MDKAAYFFFDARCFHVPDAPRGPVAIRKADAKTAVAAETHETPRFGQRRNRFPFLQAPDFKIVRLVHRRDLMDEGIPDQFHLIAGTALVHHAAIGGVPDAQADSVLGMIAE